MPTLFRFLVVLALIGGLGYAAIYALATYVEAGSRDMTVTIPPERLNRHK